MPNLDSTFSLQRLRIWNPHQLPPLRTPIGERALSASASVPHSVPMEQASLLPTWISGWSGKGSYARSLHSEGCLRPPLIYWNVERNNHFSLDVSIVDIFISSPGSKSHILAREEVKFFSSLCSRRSLWDSGLSLFIRGIEALEKRHIILSSFREVVFFLFPELMYALTADPGKFQNQTPVSGQSIGRVSRSSCEKSGIHGTILKAALESDLTWSHCCYFCRS